MQKLPLPSAKRRRPSTNTALGLIVLCLMMCLTACSTTAYKPQGDVRVPPELLRPCPLPETPKDRTVGGLVTWIQEARVVIRDCDDDKRALREWDRGLRE